MTKLNRMLAYLKVFKTIIKIVLVVVGITVLFRAEATFRSEDFTEAIYLLLLSWFMFWVSYKD